MDLFLLKKLLLALLFNGHFLLLVLPKMCASHDYLDIHTMVDAQRHLWRLTTTTPAQRRVS